MLKNDNIIEEKINELNQLLIEINDKIEKKITEFSKDILGKEIEHIKFGKGIVVQQKNSIIEIQFDKDLVKKFRIPDIFINGFVKVDVVYQSQIGEIEKLINERNKISTEIVEKQNELNNLINNKKIDVNFNICLEARECIKKGYIDVDDDIEFRTIRDVTDLFNKHYSGFQRSWIKINNDWETVAACYQMTSNSDRNIYRNVLAEDGNCFYYLIDEESDVKKEEVVRGIIEHEMKFTYLFLKYPNMAGYKFFGIFEKNREAMEKSIKDKEYKVVYKKIGDKLDLTQFFYTTTIDSKKKEK